MCVISAGPQSNTQVYSVDNALIIYIVLLYLSQDSQIDKGKHNRVNNVEKNFESFSRQGKEFIQLLTNMGLLNGRCQNRYLESRVDDQSHTESTNFLAFIVRGKSVAWI